jgi:hypothetical protein
MPGREWDDRLSRAKSEDAIYLSSNYRGKLKPHPNKRTNWKIYMPSPPNSRNRWTLWAPWQIEDSESQAVLIAYQRHYRLMSFMESPDVPLTGSMHVSRLCNRCDHTCRTSRSWKARTRPDTSIRGATALLRGSFHSGSRPK